LTHELGRRQSMQFEAYDFTRHGKALSGDRHSSFACDPLICGAMFAQIEGNQASTNRVVDATKAAVAVLVILVVAALIGARVLKIFGVSLDAFSIAGGGLLSWIGFSRG